MLDLLARRQILSTVCERCWQTEKDAQRPRITRPRLGTKQPHKADAWKDASHIQLARFQSPENPVPAAGEQNMVCASDRLRAMEINGDVHGRSTAPIQNERLAVETKAAISLGVLTCGLLQSVCRGMAEGGTN